MILYPAIDLKGGKCVRLSKGDFNKEKVYSEDPAAIAISFAEAVPILKIKLIIKILKLRIIFHFYILLFFFKSLNFYTI